MIGHECGVAAVALKSKSPEDYAGGGVLEYLKLMMIELQNRGQETCGFYSFNPFKTKTLDGPQKIFGPVTELFRINSQLERDRILKEYGGLRAIGHVRYATSGRSKSEKEWLDEAQPFYHRNGNPHKRFVLAWNGNLANHNELKEHLFNEYGDVPETSVDTELLMYLIEHNIEGLFNGNREPDFVEVLRKTQERIDGGLSLVLMNGLGHIVAYRGVPGVRPLCYGENDYLFAVASETSALAKVGIKDFNFFDPGQLIIYNDTLRSFQVGNSNDEKDCFFEKLYFAKIVSEFKNLPVNEFRERLGVKLAELEPLKDKLDQTYMVVPIPDTSIPAARKMAQRLGIEYSEVLIKNPYSGRTFIEKQEMREERMKIKFSYIPGKVEGKKILLVDDSIVRGNTAGRIVHEIRSALNPAEVHFRSTCPPIVSPCFYGIDFPTLDELIAHHYSESPNIEGEIARTIGADSMKYMTIDGLVDVFKSFGVSRDKLCLACITGKYPTFYGQKRLEELLGLSK